MLTESAAVFYDPETERTLTIPKENSWSQIVFIKNSGIMGTTEGTIATVAGVNMDMGTHKGLLLNWFPPKTKNDLKKELRNWGIGLIIVGVASILLSEYLDYIWGMGLIVIGLINLFIAHRAMFLINGIVMITAGIFNIISVIGSGFTFFFIFGIMQIGWGIGEFRKFGIYRNTVN